MNSLRPRLALWILLVAGSGIVTQLFRQQILQHAIWTKRAKQQHEVIVQEPAPRGRFFANTQVLRTHTPYRAPLVHDLTRFHLWADPRSIPEELRHAVVEQLHSCTQVPQSELLQEIMRPSRHRRLASWLDQEQRNAIREWWIGFARLHKLPRNALHFVQDYQRVHPYGALAGAVLHTIRDFKDEATQQGLPTGGLELTLNHYLNGVPGKKLFRRSPLHMLDEGQVIEPAIPGADIELTINPIVQSIAENALKDGCNRASAKAGWAIVMQVDSGEILALAQYPGFNPDSYAEYFNNQELTEHTKVHAIVDVNEPGSVMKPITAAIALQANVELCAKAQPPIFLPEEKIKTLPRSFAGRNKRLADLGLYKYLNLDMAIQKSSNVYFATLAERIVQHMGAKWYFQSLANLGFGKVTSVDLVGEVAGIVPNPAISGSRVGAWSGSTPYSLAMGHGLTCTSLQLIQAYNCIANNGLFVKPALVRRVWRHSGSKEIELFSLADHRRRTPLKRILDSEVAARVMQAMRFSCTATGGGKRARLQGYTCAGKSGTAEKVVGGRYDKNSNFASFIGIAPAKKPYLVVFVGLDEPAPIYVDGVKNSLGGVCAAPVFQEIMQQSLKYLGIPPDDPHTLPQGDTERAVGPYEWEQQVSELNQLRELWQKQ